MNFYDFLLLGLCGLVIAGMVIATMIAIRR